MNLKNRHGHAEYANIVQECERSYILGFLWGYHRHQGVFYDNEQLRKIRNTDFHYYIDFYKEGIQEGSSWTSSATIAPDYLRKFAGHPISYRVDPSSKPVIPVKEKTIKPPYYSFTYTSTFFYDLSDIQTQPSRVLKEFIPSHFAYCYKKAEERAVDKTGKLDPAQLQQLLSDHSWNKQFVNFVYKYYVIHLHIQALSYPNPQKYMNEITLLYTKARSLNSMMESELTKRGHNQAMVEFHHELIYQCKRAIDQTSMELEIIKMQYEKPVTSSYEFGLDNLEMFISANTFDY